MIKGPTDPPSGPPSERAKTGAGSIAPEVILGTGQKAGEPEAGRRRSGGVIPNLNDLSRGLKTKPHYPTPQWNSTTTHSSP